MKLYCKINDIRYEIGEGATFSEEYNETLDSGAIILDHISTRLDDLKPYDDVFIYDDETNGNNFYKHMLVDNFTEEANNVRNMSYMTYKYKISLFSEIKRLDKVVCPNISITQPLDKTKRRTIKEYLENYLRLYGPKIKVVNGSRRGEKSWRYVSKYSYSQRLLNLFSNINAPEMSLSSPTLRDIISKLLVVKDCIPVVHDDEIDYLDISVRQGEFKVNDNVNFIHSSMGSDNYSIEARRNYSGAISQDSSAKIVEYTSLRNSNTPILTIENLRLETRYPIYKINKIYMCYYKKVDIKGYSDSKSHQNTFMVKQDITSLVVQNVIRSALISDPTKFDPSSITSLSDLSKYRMVTVGYDIGSNYITGWGETYTYHTSAWFKKEYTVLQNIVQFMDKKFPFGVKGSYISKENNSDIITTFDPNDGGLESIFDGGVYQRSGASSSTNKSIKQKALFFEIDYNAMFNGSVIHTKDFINNDDIQTTDNCESSLTILEADGLFEKEKMNRFANRTYSLQSRYEGSNAYNNMNNAILNNHVLGSYIYDDIIMYHKQYSIFENFVQANFTGTYDYVLKNYFTSVFAKLRTYNLASYGESISRSEVYKEYLLLSDNENYYDSDSLFKDCADKLITCFKSTNIPKIVYNFSNLDKVNFSYIQTKFSPSTSEQITSSMAFSDTNVFTCGFSLCINIRMFDNATQGIYVSNPIGFTDDDNEIKGSVQEWKIAVDNVEDPFQEYMTFGFGHMYVEGDNIPEGKSPLLPEKGSQTTDVRSEYENKLLYFPTFKQNYLEHSDFYINNNKTKIYKDNKEVIDYTFQIEPITNSKNIFFSQWFSKLCDLSGNYNKWEENGSVINNDDLVKNLSSQIFFGKSVVSSSVFNAFFCIRVKKGSIFLLKPYNLRNPSDSIQSQTYKTEYEDVYYYKLKSIDNYRMYGYGVNKERAIDVTMELYVNGSLQSTSSYFFVSANSSSEILDPEYAETCDFEKYDYYQTCTFYTEFVSSEQPTTIDYTFLGTTSGIYFGEDSFVYRRNMFAISSTEEIKKELIYNEYDLEFDPLGTLYSDMIVNMPSSWTIFNDAVGGYYDGRKFSDVFQIVDYQGKKAIKIGNALLPARKSIQFWFLDDTGTSDGSGQLKFVFGINTTKAKNYVVASTMKRRSTNVYSHDHKRIVAKIRNVYDDATHKESNQIEDIGGVYTGTISYVAKAPQTATGIVDVGIDLTTTLPLDVGGYKDI